MSLVTGTRPAPEAAAGPVRRRGLWITVAVITAVVVLVPAGLSTWGKLDRTSAPVGHDFGPASALALQLDGGQAVVRAGAGGGIFLTGTLTWAWFKPVVSWSWAGRVLSVSVRCGPRLPVPVSDVLDSACWGVQLQLAVPAGLPVSADAGAGEVVVHGLAGRLHLLATSGEITGSGLTCSSVTAAVDSGDINLRFAGRPSAVSAAVASGSVEITVPDRSRYRVTRRVGSGSASVAPGLDDSAAAGRIDVSAGSGSLSVGYP